MLAQHRNKALAGVGCWLASLVIFFALLIVVQRQPDNSDRVSSDWHGMMFVAGLFIQFFLYLWGCHHLAKGKGQPEASILLGLLCFIGQLIALVLFLALPDKYRQHTHQDDSQRRRK